LQRIQLADGIANKISVTTTDTMVANSLKVNA